MNGMWTRLLGLGAALVLSGCCATARPHEDDTPNALASLSLDEVIRDLGDDVQKVRVKITPILAAFRYTDRGRATPALGVSVNGRFESAEARPFENRAIDYSHGEQYFKKVELSAPALQRFLLALSSTPRFNGTRLSERPLLSVLVIRPGRGFSEVFIDARDGRAFAKALTDAAVGTTSLQLLIQWEMNL